MQLGFNSITTVLARINIHPSASCCISDNCQTQPHRLAITARAEGSSAQVTEPGPPSCYTTEPNLQRLAVTGDSDGGGQGAGHGAGSPVATSHRHGASAAAAARKGGRASVAARRSESGPAQPPSVHRRGRPGRTQVTRPAWAQRLTGSGHRSLSPTVPTGSDAITAFQSRFQL